MPKSLTFLGNFCEGVKIYHFSSEIIFGQLLQTFGDFYLVTLVITNMPNGFEERATDGQLPTWTKMLFDRLVVTLPETAKRGKQRGNILSTITFITYLGREMAKNIYLFFVRSHNNDFWGKSVKNYFLQ